MGKNLAPDLNPSSSDFSKLAKMSGKELGKVRAAFDPDKWDLDNIEQAIGRYEVENPGTIARMFRDLEVEISLSGISKNAELGKGGLRKGFWLPAATRPGRFDLANWMEKAYPSLWREEKHARWFVRHFPVFSFEHAAKRKKL